MYINIFGFLTGFLAGGGMREKQNFVKLSHISKYTQCVLSSPG